MFGKLFNKKITVNFIDATTGDLIGTSEMPLEQLPDSFEVDTQLSISEEEWSVEDATPKLKEEFSKTRSLTLKLRKLEYVDRRTLNFTLPTVSNEFPEIDDQSVFRDFEIVILEDDWRQKEFINLATKEIVEKEIQGIRLIWNNESEYVETAGFHAFKNIHLRGSIGMPNLKIDFAELTELLSADKVGGIRVNGHDGFAKNGFVIKTSSTTFYGTVSDGQVTQLCIQEMSENSEDEILKINSLHDLLFVDWVNCKVIDTNPVETIN